MMVQTIGFCDLREQEAHSKALADFLAAESLMLKNDRAQGCGGAGFHARVGLNVSVRASNDCPDAIRGNLLKPENERVNKDFERGNFCSGLFQGFRFSLIHRLISRFTKPKLNQAVDSGKAKKEAA